MSATLLHEEERKAAVQTLTDRSSSRRRAHTPYKTASRLLTILPPVLLGALLLGSWYFSTSRGLVSSYELPAPADVWAALWNGLTTGLFLHMAWVTIQESIGGFLLAVIIALPVGYALTKSRIFAVTFNPYLVAGQAIPAIVLAPFLDIWMGYSIWRIVVLCMLVVLFAMVIMTALGFRSIERSLLEAARVEGAGFWPMLARIEFPLAMPALMAAVRTGLTLSVIGALVGEFVTNTDQGLGALVQIAQNQYNVALMFATVIVMAILATIFYGISWGLTKLSEAIYL